MSRNRVDVIVVAYKSGEDLECLERDLPVMSAFPYKLYLWDNTGNPKTLTAAWNHEGSKGDAPYLAFLNTDIRLSPGWDERLIAALERDANVGAVIPKPVGHGWPTYKDPPEPGYPSPENAPAPDPGTMKRISDLYADRRKLSGFGACNATFYAVMIQRKMWSELKGFDERFRFYGQDHDFQRRLKQRFGKIAATVFSCPVWHRCGGSRQKAVGHVDFNKELIHLGKVRKGLNEGTLKDWDYLSAEEIEAIRQNSLYNKMPVYPGREL